METLRIGFIGAGGMGNHHAHEVARRENARVAALCDPSPQARERLLKTLGAAAEGVKAYALPEEMLAAEKLDAVVITTPHTQHADHVRAALEAGLHVLVEKPMTTTARDARELGHQRRAQGAVRDDGEVEARGPHARGHAPGAAQPAVGAALVVHQHLVHPRPLEYLDRAGVTRREGDLRVRAAQ